MFAMTVDAPRGTYRGIMDWLNLHSPLRLYSMRSASVDGFFKRIFILHDGDLAVVFKLTWGDSIEELSPEIFTKD